MTTKILKGNFVDDVDVDCFLVNAAAPLTHNHVTPLDSEITRLETLSQTDFVVGVGKGKFKPRFFSGNVIIKSLFLFIVLSLELFMLQETLKTQVNALSVALDVSFLSSGKCVDPAQARAATMCVAGYRHYNITDEEV